MSSEQKHPFNIPISLNRRLTMPYLNAPLQMCVPLIVQDKISLAESFVAGHSQLEERLVTLLDSWCRPSFSMEEIRRYGASTGT